MVLLAILRSHASVLRYFSSRTTGSISERDYDDESRSLHALHVLTFVPLAIIHLTNPAEGDEGKKDSVVEEITRVSARDVSSDLTDRTARWLRRDEASSANRVGRIGLPADAQRHFRNEYVNAIDHTLWLAVNVIHQPVWRRLAIVRRSCYNRAWNETFVRAMNKLGVRARRNAGIKPATKLRRARYIYTYIY